MHVVKQQASLDGIRNHISYSPCLQASNTCRHPILQCMDRHDVQFKQRCGAAHETVQAFWRDLLAAGEGLLQGLRVELM